MASSRHMHLGFTIWPTGFHPGAWRLPGSPTDGNSNPALLQDAARTAERGAFDFFFIGDRVVSLPESQLVAPNEVLRPEALTLAANLAAVTQHIGLVTTVNTTYSDPFNVARAAATIDHLSGGRVGLNIVTGKNTEAARNFGRTEHWDNARRYDWATEFVEILGLLWDSWEEGARVADRETGQFVDESRIHRINYEGEFFSVAGPLNVERPVQGRIPLINAGSSERSRVLGARFADLRFTNSSTLGIEGARDYYRDLKGRLAAYGRTESEQLVIPGVAVYTATTERAARELYARVQEQTKAKPDLDVLSAALGVDVAGAAPEAPFREVADPSAATTEGVAILREVEESYGRTDLTLREISASLRRRGLFKELVGSPTQIADFLQEWFEGGAADGFMIFPPRMPEGLEAFVELVLPELRRRGLFRSRYHGSTLRAHLGLKRPENQFAAQRSADLAHQSEGGPISEVFISPDELAERITRDDIVVLDVRYTPQSGGDRDGWAEGHIPGAVYVDLPTELSRAGEESEGRRPLPEPLELQDAARRWGINQGSTVVVYDDRSGLSAARAWWLLRWAGLGSVRILTGGKSAWTAAGHALSTDTPTVRRGTIVITPGGLPVIGADDATEYARDGHLLDARADDAYIKGHIPGAVSTPAPGNLDGAGTLAAADQLIQRYAFLNQGDIGRVGVYCGSGVSATFQVAVLASLGKEAALYPGSWSAWSSDVRRPVVMGPDPHDDNRAESGG